MGPVYLDYNATTPLDVRVFEEMRPFFLHEPGNAASRTHSYGHAAAAAVDLARKRVARLVGAGIEEIVFTSGPTESNNAVLFGLEAYGKKVGRTHILASAIEHASVLDPLRVLYTRGFEIELLPVTSGGYVEPGELLRRLRPDTLLVSLMHANNETGVRQPLKEVASIVAETDTLLHTDAAQTFGKDVEELQQAACDFMSISAHKIYGPKGVGALYVRRSGSRRLPLLPIMYGGGQERGLRPGTVAVPLVVGLGMAAELASSEFVPRQVADCCMKRAFLESLGAVDHVVNGDSARIQPHVLNVSFPGVDGEALMFSLRRTMAFSNGAACSSARYARSHVLKAMGLDDDRIASSVRFSWGAGLGPVPFKALIGAVRSLGGKGL